MTYTTGTSHVDDELIKVQAEQIEDWLKRICGKPPDAISWAIALEQVAGKIRRTCAEQGRSAETR